MLHQTTCGDTQIAYRDTGQGPAVVFAHAMGFDHSIWDAVTRILPQELRLVCYDLRGHGASGTPPAPYSMGALIRDAEALLDQLSIRDCVFVGSGLGGMVAQGLAVKRLDQIRALVLTNTATKLGTKDRWAQAMEAVRSTGLATRIEADIAQNFSAAFRKSGGVGPWKSLLRHQRQEGFLGCAAAVAGTDFYTTTASLRLPSLVIACAQDSITPADMVRELADLIPGARFDLIRNAGHLPMIEAPERFSQALAAFLRGIGHIQNLQKTNII